MRKISTTSNSQNDEWLEEKHLSQAHWRVRLSNGEVVLQDDERPGVQPASAWQRLAEYVSSQRLTIEALWLVFRSNVVRPLPEHAGGYFFRNSSFGSMVGGQTASFFLIGYLHDGILRVQKWKVPELLIAEQEFRDPDDHRLVGQSLIRNERLEKSTTRPELPR